MVTSPLEVVKIPAGINKGLSSAKNSTMIQVLGLPRDVIDHKCRLPNKEPIKSLTITANVGPFRATGLKPAIESLTSIMKEISESAPKVYKIMGSSGMSCVRLIKNSQKISNHAWGCAIDINLSGALDGIGVAGGTGKLDGKTLAGLCEIAPFFNKSGWYWGVGFKTFEDGMHFEVAEETLRDWHKKGLLDYGAAGQSLAPTILTRGDSGIDVKEIQIALRKLGYDILDDGDFGPLTQAVVIDFQSRNGLFANGVVDKKTLKKLLRGS